MKVLPGYFCGSRAGEHRSARRSRRGLTLIESMISILVLAITVTGVTALFNSGLSSLEEGGDAIQLDSALRSKVETLVSRPFADVLAEGSGAENFSIRSVPYTVSWSATKYDIDGDGTPEDDAMLLKVSLQGRTLQLLQVDHGGRLGVVP